MIAKANGDLNPLHEKEVLRSIFLTSEARAVSYTADVPLIVRRLWGLKLIEPRYPAPQGWRVTQAGMARLNELMAAQ